MRFWQSIDGFNYYDYEKENKEGKTIGYSQEYGAYCLCATFSLLMTIFTGWLTIYHSYLILFNVTTWEQQRRYKISYLKDYPSGFNPFDQGIFNNLKMVFCLNKDLIKWQLPSIDESKKQANAHFNWFENEYYSCC